MQTEITINVNVLSLDRLFGGSQAIVTKARAMEDANIDGIVAPGVDVIPNDPSTDPSSLLAHNRRR